MYQDKGTRGNILAAAERRDAQLAIPAVTIMPARLVLLLPLLAALVAGAGLLIPFLGDDFVYLYRLLAHHQVPLSALFFHPLSQVLTEGAYRPVSELSYLLDTLVFGASATSHHATQLLCHVLATVLVWHLVRLLLPQRPWVSYLTGMLFAVHPIHGEALFWLPGRADLLCTIFLLLSMNLYLRGRGEGKRRRATFFSLLFFLVALLCHETALSVPLLLVLLDGLAYSPAPSSATWSQRIYGHLPHYLAYLGVILGYLFLRWIALDSISLFTLPSGARALFQCAHSFKLLLLPLETRTGLRGGVVLILSGLSIVILFLHHARPGDRRTMALSLAWIVLTIFPSLMVLRRSHLYLSSVGITIFLGILFAGLLQRGHDRAPPPWLRKMSLVALLLVLASSGLVLTYQARQYRQAGHLIQDLLAQLRQRLPRPSMGQTLYWVNVPAVLTHWAGDVPVLAFGLPEAVKLTYAREDVDSAVLSSLYLHQATPPRPHTVRSPAGCLNLRAGGGAYAFSFHSPQLTTGRDRPKMGMVLSFDHWSTQLTRLQDQLITALRICPLDAFDPLDPLLIWDGRRLELNTASQKR